MMPFITKIRYLLSLKSSIAYAFSHYFAKSLVNSYDSLPIEKRLTLHNVTILIKSVFNKEKNDYHYKIFLEKAHINFYQFLSIFYHNHKFFLESIIVFWFRETKVAKDKFCAAKIL